MGEIVVPLRGFFIGFRSRPGVALRYTPGYSIVAAPRRFAGGFAPPVRP